MAYVHIITTGVGEEIRTGFTTHLVNDLVPYQDVINLQRVVDIDKSLERLASFIVVDPTHIEIAQLDHLLGVGEVVH